MPGPRPEYTALQLAAAASFDAARAEQLAGLVADGMDWEYLYQEATHHGLLQRLYVRLGQSVETPPADEGYARLLRSVQRVVSPLAALALFLSTEMRTLAAALDAAALPFLVLKGPALAEAYGGIGQRPFVDNDLLVRREDFDGVDAALRNAGFAAKEPAGGRRGAYLYIHGEMAYGRQVTGQVSTVDVHTAIVPPGMTYRESFDALHARARTLTVLGTPMPTLSWEDALVAQAVNGLKDQWRRLRLVADVAALATRVTDWPAVQARATATGTRRALHVALLLSAREGLSPPPPGVLAAAESDATARRLADWIGARLRQPTTLVSQRWSDRMRLTLASQDRWTGRLRYASFVTVRRLTERYVTPA